MPGTASSVASSAARIAARLPMCVSRAFLAFAAETLHVVERRAQSVRFFPRRIRARFENRCASSRSRASRKRDVVRALERDRILLPRQVDAIESFSLSRLSRRPLRRRGRLEEGSRSFARATIGRSCSPRSCAAAIATASCPRPPSTTKRSGRSQSPPAPRSPRSALRSRPRLGRRSFAAPAPSAARRWLAGTFARAPRTWRRSRR